MTNVSQDLMNDLLEGSHFPFIQNISVQVIVKPALTYRVNFQ